MFGFADEQEYDPENDPFTHTEHRPFCIDPSCPDKNDHAAMVEVAQSVVDGLMTIDEAVAFYAGQLV